MPKYEFTYVRVLAKSMIGRIEELNAFGAERWKPVSGIPEMIPDDPEAVAYLMQREIQ